MIDTAKAIAGVWGRRCAARAHHALGRGDDALPPHPGRGGGRAARAPGARGGGSRPDGFAAPAAAGRERPERARARAGGALHAVGQPGRRRRRSARPRRLLAGGHRPDPPDREAAALGALLAGYASGAAGFAVHHAVCQTHRAGGRHAARRDERGDAPPQRPPHGRARARRARRLRGGARRAEPRPRRGARWLPSSPRRTGHTRLPSWGGGGARGRRWPPRRPGIRRLGNTPEPPGEAEIARFVRGAL